MARRHGIALVQLICIILFVVHYPCFASVVHVQSTVPNPPFWTVLSTVSGPQAYSPSDSLYNDSIVRVCVPHTELRGAIELYIIPVMDNVFPTKTAELRFTGVLLAADNMFKIEPENMCDFGLAYSEAIPRLKYDKVLRSLNPFFTRYQARFGYSPHNNMPPQSFNDLYLDGQWWAIPHLFQNLALMGNVTALNALNLTVPPPVGPLSVNDWDWKTLVHYINEGYYKGKIQEPYVSEPCMIGQAMIASGLHVGVSLINEEGKCGWRNNPDIRDMVEDIWIEMYRDKPHMFARHVDLDKPIVQEYINTLLQGKPWPPERTFYIPREPCTLATYVPLFSTLYKGSKPEIQGLFSAGRSNTIQTWGFFVTNATRQPDVAWEFLSYMIDCSNPPMKNLIVNITRQIPAFEHCIAMPEVQAMINARPSLQRTFAERAKSFPVTHPIAPFPNIHRFENDSAPAIFLIELALGLFPLDNLAEYFPVDYSQLATRHGQGGVLYPSSPMYDKHEAATRAINRFCDQIEYIQKPDCEFPQDIVYKLEECTRGAGTESDARILWNPDHVNRLCLATVQANVTLAKIAAAERIAACPYTLWASPTGNVIAFMSALGLLASVTIATIWIWKRHELKASAVGLTLILIGGALLLYLASIAMMERSCFWFYTLMSSGLIAIAGSLFTKQYRVDIIFTGKHFRVVKLQEWKMMLVVLGMLILNWIFVAIWDSVRGKESTYQSVEQFGDGTLILAMPQCNHGPAYMLGIWGLFFFALCLATSWYGFRLRKVPKEFSDTAFVAYSNTILGILVVLLVFVAILLKDSPKSLTLVLVCSSWFVGTMVLIIYFVSRWLKICDKKGRGLESSELAPAQGTLDPMSMLSQKKNSQEENGSQRKDSSSVSMTTTRVPALSKTDMNDVPSTLV